eukprot:UN04385
MISLIVTCKLVPIVSLTDQHCVNVFACVMNSALQILHFLKQSKCVQFYPMIAY